MPNLLARFFSDLFAPPARREADRVVKALESRLTAAQRRMAEAYDRIDSLASDWEREREELRAGGQQAGRRGARRNGDMWPFLRNMEDLTECRTASREACDGNGYGAGMLDRAVDFVVGDGMQPEITLWGAGKGAVSTGVTDADGDGRPDADPRVVAVQAIIDEFRALNDWGCGEEDREEEGFRRSQRDGEVFVRFFKGGADTNWIPRVRWGEPEQVDSPPNAMPEERWGVRHAKGDVETREAYYFYDSDDGTGGEWWDADRVVHHKLGTDRTVLRGMPQFWLVAKAFEQCESLNSAVAEVSAIQAQIAYVREHAPGILPNQITDFVGGTGDGLGRKSTPYGDKYRRVGYSENGTVVDMSAGTKFGAGPVSTGVPGFVAALQSRLRQICARFGYPEFFTSDASNGNYASLLAAGGPSERNFKRRQRRYAAFQAAVYRRACEYAVKAGRLSASDLAAVEIKVKPGGVAIANKLEEAQVQQIRIQNKLLSPQSAMVENGHDPRVELANMQAFDDQFGGGAGGMGGGGMDDGGNPFGGGGAPAGESYTADEYELLSEADRSHLVKKTITNSRGHKQTVYVLAAGPAPKADRKAAAANAKEQAARLVRDGVKTPQQAKELAGHLKNMTVADIQSLQREHAAKLGGRLKQDKVDRLVAFAQGRGSVERGKAAEVPAPVTPAAPKAGDATPAGAELQRVYDTLDTATDAEVKAALDGLAGLNDGQLRKVAADIALELDPGDDAKRIRRQIQRRVNDIRDSLVRDTLAQRAPTPTPTPPATQAGTVPPKAEFEASVMGEVEKGLRERHTITGMVPIHELRDAIRKKYGDEAGSHEHFDETVLGLWRQGRLRMTSLEDAGAASLKQRQDSIPGVGETLFYVEMPHDSRVV